MAEVRKQSTSKSKKSSKILDQNNNLSNDELLEQILKKKKNKSSRRNTTTKDESTSINKKKESSTKPKKKVDKKEIISSDDLYEQIKAKRTIKKRPTPKKRSSNEKEVSFSKAIREIEEENPDLIITREIRFDDLSANLKNKKNLEELRKAIEFFDKLDNFDNKNKDDNDIEILPFVRYSNYKLRKLFIIVGIVVLVLSLLSGVGTGFAAGKDFEISFKQVEKTISKNKNDEEEKRKREEELRKKELYEECLDRDYSEKDNTEFLMLGISELDLFIKENYKASVSYEDLSSGFKYSYDGESVYYAASTIKSLDALYIYSKAVAGEIDLEDTVTYTSRFKVSYSTGVRQHKLGSKISLRNLVKYAIIYSDNSAHQMLVSYIGRNNLKEFGKSLGAVNTLNGGDNFGHISANDGLVYMKALYDFFDNNGELGLELKDYFLNSLQKELSVDNYEVANKYGMYKNYYHNIGIVYVDQPYVVSIMTLEGLKDREEIINLISEKVYKLHNSFLENRKNICKLEIYGE